MDDLELRLNNLKSRRELLEEKISLKSNTLNDFSNLRDEKIKKVVSTLEIQYEEAKKRNLTILRDISYQINSYSKICTKLKDTSLNSSTNKLREARLEYLRKIEKLLPIWRVNNTNKRLEKVRELHTKKEIVEKRRKNRISLEIQDIKAQALLEKERKEYLHQLSLEQKEELDINTKLLIKKIKDRKEDETFLNQTEEILDKHKSNFENLNLNDQNILILQKGNYEENPKAAYDLPLSNLINKQIKTYESPLSPKSSLHLPENITLVIPVSDEIPKNNIESHSPASQSYDRPNSPKKSDSPLHTSSSKSEKVLDVDTNNYFDNPHSEHISLTEYGNVLKQIFNLIESGNFNLETCLSNFASYEKDKNAYLGLLKENIKNLEHNKVFSLMITIFRKIGDTIFPSDLLNGIVTLDKVEKFLKKLSDGRLEIFKSIINHLKHIADSTAQDVQNLCELYSTNFISYIPEEEERLRLKRKISKLLHIAAISNEKTRSHSPPKSPQKSAHSTDYTQETGEIEDDFERPEEIVKISTLPNQSKITKFSRGIFDDELNELEDLDFISPPPLVKDLAEE